MMNHFSVWAARWTNRMRNVGLKDSTLIFWQQWAMKTHTHRHNTFRELRVSPRLAAIAKSVYRLVKAWKVRGSNPGGCRIFRTRPDRHWGPPSLPYNGYRVSSLGIKRPGSGVDHPSPSSAEVIPLLLISAFMVCSRANFKSRLLCNWQPAHPGVKPPSGFWPDLIKWWVSPFQP